MKRSIMVTSSEQRLQMNSPYEPGSIIKLMQANHAYGTDWLQSGLAWWGQLGARAAGYCGKLFIYVCNLCAMSVYDSVSK